MRNRSQKIRLGVFLFVSLAILLSVIGFLTAREFFEKEDVYYVSYEDISVSGLEVGSPVKYMGIKVGTIQDINIDPQNVNKIILELALKPDVPIKKNAQAEITSVGLTGLKAIEIRGGSNEAENLKPGSYIQAGSSITREITGKAETIAQKAEKVLNNLQMGVFYQNGGLLNSLTVGENIALPLEQHTDLNDELITRVVWTKLQLVNLLNAYYLYPSQLSGGMLKRAALARAIVMDPLLLFCDEPGAGLDPISLASLDDLILNLREQMGMSIVIITHEVSSILRIADRIIFISRGKKIFQGTLKDALESDIEQVYTFFEKGRSIPENPT